MRLLLGRGRTAFSKCSFAAVWLVLLAITPAQASVDSCFDVGFSLGRSAFDGCSNLPVLGPGNDTRVNLLLLLFDRDRQPPELPPGRRRGDLDPLLDWREFRDRFFAQAAPSPRGFAIGEGSRCRSNDPGAAAFATAVTVAAGLTDEERKALIDARKNLKPNCETKSGVDVFDIKVDAAHSAAGQDFVAYLRGASAFYWGHFDAALDIFGRLHGNANAWIANTADYMVARTRVNLLQVSAFDKYGEFKGGGQTDQDAATRAVSSLETYLRDYPDGIYAASARGLLRRVYWLAGRADRLAAAYEALLKQAPDARDIDDATLVEEIDSKLLPVVKQEMVHDPILLAVLDLKAMRERESKAVASQDAPTAKPNVDLDAQRETFADAVPLFEFLVATQVFYRDHDAPQVIKLVPDDTRRRDGDRLWFSRQVLRGLALDAKGDRNAQGFWKELYPGVSRPLDQLTIELGLAMHDERAGKLGDVFAPGSIVTDANMRHILIENIADAEILRRVVRTVDAPPPERQSALVTLLYKEVTRGRYTDFLSDLADVPANLPTEKSRFSEFAAKPPSDLDCPLLAVTAKQLANDPRAVRGRLCLSEFLRSYGMPDETRPSAETLGGGRSLFVGKPLTRTYIYKAIIADEAATDDERAYALYRAVMCYAPSGNNECGEPTVPKAKRKAWYKTLKRDYPDSRWAKDLSLWW